MIVANGLQAGRRAVTAVECVEVRQPGWEVRRGRLIGSVHTHQETAGVCVNSITKLNEITL